ncbi:MAG: hypothetical protein AB7G93_05330 [Bdellovibrionales bacterium]
MDSIDPQVHKQEIEPFRIENLERLTTDLKDMLKVFQKDPTPENFAHVVSALQAFGFSGVQLWRDAAEYTRRHPVRMGLLVGLILFAIKGMTGTRHSTSTHNGRRWNGLKSASEAHPG